MEISGEMGCGIHQVTHIYCPQAVDVLKLGYTPQNRGLNVK
jgi:hypothetical protein